MNTPLLAFDDVTKRFGQTAVLQDLTFSVHSSEVVVVIGPSGSGKSTLLRCVNRLEDIHSGEIRLNGTPITSDQYDVNELRQHVGMVFQEFNLFPHMSVLENLTLAPQVVKHHPGKNARKKAHNLLEEVGLRNKVDANPSNLSGGQKQRVAIARALSMEPEVMLFDEVTSALDPELVGDVLSVMENLASQGMTMLIVTHQMDFARDVGDRILMLDNGRLVEQGPPDQLFAHPDTSRAKEFLSSVL